MVLADVVVSGSLFQSVVVMFYKITHDLIDINAPSYLLPGDAKTRGANRYRQPATDKDIYKFSFFPRTTTDWTIF
jgi:hypothetical protein